MGAQTEKRRQMFMDRYAEVEKSEGEGIYRIALALFCNCVAVYWKGHMLICRRPVGTVSLLHPLLVGHHRRLLPRQDGALFTHLPDSAGEATKTRTS